MKRIEEIVWLAGLLEGEGCFGNYASGRSRHRYIRIQLAMNDEDIIKRAASIMQGSLQGPYTCGTRKGTWVTTAGNTQSPQWMMTVYPFMGKRRQAQIRACLMAWKAQPGRRLGRPKVKEIVV